MTTNHASDLPAGALRVTLLGTGDPFGTGQRLQACVLLECAEGRYLMDCGATSLVALARAGVPSASVDAVMISHLHGDHAGGLPFLILDPLAGISLPDEPRRTRPLLIAGPVETEERVAQTANAFGYINLVERSRGAGQVEFAPLLAGVEATVGPFRVTPYAVPHTPEALALRLAYGSTVLAYSGDTAWSDTLIELSDNADLFICEVFTHSTPSPIMLSYETLRDQRARFTCKRLLLTHIGAEMQRHLSAVSEEVAEDGMTIVL